MNTDTTTTARPVAAVTNVLPIEPQIYQALAEALLDKIGERDYLPQTMLEIEGEGDMLFRLSIAAIIYHGIDYWPDGAVRTITNVVPIWWELHSFRGDVEVLNNATFDRIKEYIID